MGIFHVAASLWRSLLLVPAHRHGLLGHLNRTESLMLLGTSLLFLLCESNCLCVRESFALFQIVFLKCKPFFKQYMWLHCVGKPSILQTFWPSNRAVFGFDLTGTVLLCSHCTLSPFSLSGLCLAEHCQPFANGDCWLWSSLGLFCARGSCLCGQSEWWAWCQ